MQRELKRNARMSVKRHYYRNVLVVFICSLLLVGGFNYTTKNIRNIDVHDKKVSQIINNKTLTSSEVIDEVIEKTSLSKKMQIDIQNKYTKGVISYLINVLISSRSLVFVILNTINKVVFHSQFSIQITIILSSIFIGIFSILFLQVILVGKCRYFLEERRYFETRMDRVLFPYLVKRTFHISYILFIRSICQILWNFTIVFGWVKYYEYRFIPYLLADNPNISLREAFFLSKEMSKGYKWQMFCLDLSMLGWDILKVCTFNLSGIFYSNVYKEALIAEVYMNIRKEKINILKDSFFLPDSYLDVPSLVMGSYPDWKFSIPLKHMRQELKVNYGRDYSIKSYILLFFTFSIIGFLWEVLLHLISDGVFVNRGTMHGPWLPIYGTGGVMILILLKKYRDNPFKLFLATVVLCGGIEYGTAFFLETFRHLKYWDYTGYFLNINGRICLEGLLVFGLGGCGFTYILAPILDNLYQKLSSKVSIGLCVILISFFAIDFVYSSFYPNTGTGISKSVYGLGNTYLDESILS